MLNNKTLGIIQILIALLMSAGAKYYINSLPGEVGAGLMILVMFIVYPASIGILIWGLITINIKNTTKTENPGWKGFILRLLSFLLAVPALLGFMSLNLFGGLFSKWGLIIIMLGISSGYLYYRSLNK